MKIRESGMPEETCWAGFFDAGAVLDMLLGERVHGEVVEVGCGYGTFSLPAARRTVGVLHALDIEPAMVTRVQARAAAARLDHLRASQRDVVADGTGLPAASQVQVMLFNLLHLAEPQRLLEEALRVLEVDGRLSVLHWRSDIPTPRGPPLAIRPTPQQCRQWLVQAGFRMVESVPLAAAAPYHFALRALR